MERNEENKTCVCSIHYQDEEDLLYQEYLAIKKKINFWKDYIESLRQISDEKNIKKAFDDDARFLAYDYLLAVHFLTEKKALLAEEKERIEKHAIKILRNTKKHPGLLNSEYEETKEELIRDLCDSDDDYNEAKREYDLALIEEQKRKKIVETFCAREATIIKENLVIIREDIVKAYEEIEELEHKKVEIIEKMDYIVYGRQKVKG